MKTKNMRKKALLSSVAMLLVAVVALSGATYAWFIQNQDATANGIRLKTESASTLVISTTGAEGTFQPTVSVNWSAILKPVSSEDGTAFFEASGGSATGVQKDTPVTGISSAQGTPYISGEVWVKSSIDALVKLKSITVPTNQENVLAKALRVAVTIGEGASAVTKVFAPGNDNPASGTTSKIVLKEASTVSPVTDVTYDDLYNGRNASNLGWTTEGHGYGTCVISKLDSETIGRISENTATKLSIKIWLEGNDEDCTNDLSGQLIGNWAGTDPDTATIDANTGMALVFTSIPAPPQQP